MLVLESPSVYFEQEAVMRWRLREAGCFLLRAGALLRTSRCKTLSLWDAQL